VKWREATVRVCLASVAFPLQAVPAPDSGRFLIDIEAKSIGSVRVTDALPQLRKPFGADNVAKATENVEGDPSSIVVVAVDGHKLAKHWKHVSTDDPVFKIKGGLGPGSTLAASEQTFGPASRGEGEGGWYVDFRIGKSDEFQVRVGDACLDEQLRLKSDSTCIVKEILLFGHP
jgi:hypothetical protein